MLWKHKWSKNGIRWLWKEIIQDHSKTIILALKLLQLYSSWEWHVAEEYNPSLPFRKISQMNIPSPDIRSIPIVLDIPYDEPTLDGYNIYWGWRKIYRVYQRRHSYGSNSANTTVTAQPSLYSMQRKGTTKKDAISISSHHLLQ